MSFENPEWLALLAALPVLWLLHRRRRGPVVLRVSSVAPFRAAAQEPASARPRRPLDPSLLLLLAAASLLAFSAAGAVLGGGGAPRLYVVVDTSASMGARLADGRSVLVDALARVSELGAEAVVRALDDPRAAALVRRLDDGDAFAHLPAPAGADGLPGALAPHLELARAQGYPGVLLVTDRALALPGVVVVGPSSAPGPNFGIVGVVLDGDEMVVSLRSTSAVDAEAVIEEPAARRVLVPAGGSASTRFAAPAKGITGIGITVRLRSADALPADDVVVAQRVGGANVARLEPTVEGLGAVVRALRACGVDPSGSETPDLVVRRGSMPTTEGRLPLLQFAAAPGPGPGLTVTGVGAGVVRGSALQGRGELAAGLPSPGATLVATGRIEGGEPVLLDAEGALAVTVDDALITCLDPADPASTWHEEPSFVVFVAAALEHLAGWERLVVAGGVPPSEIDVARSEVRLPDAEEVAALARRGGVGNGTGSGIRLSPWLALAAAVCTLGAVLLRRSGAIRVPSWGPDRAR